MYWRKMTLIEYDQIMSIRMNKGATKSSWVERARYDEIMKEMEIE